MLCVTAQAVEKAKNALAEEGHQDAALRVIVVPSGPGAQYMLSLESEPSEDDVVLNYDGLRVLVDSDSASLLEDAEIDYVEGLMRSGFVINNPNLPAMAGGGGCGSAGGCGCGNGGGGGGGCGCGSGEGGGCGGH